MQGTLFDATAVEYSREYLAAVEFFDGDKAKAKAVIDNGKFIFLPKVQSVSALGWAVLKFHNGKISRKLFKSFADVEQGRKELRDSGGKITRYGFFQFRGGKGLIEESIRRRELVERIGSVMSDVADEMVREGYFQSRE